MLLLLPLLLSVCLCAPFSVCVRPFVNMHTEWIKKDLRLFRVAPFARLCPVTRAHAPQTFANANAPEALCTVVRFTFIRIVCYKFLSTQSQPASAGSACFIRQSTECTRNMQLLHSMLQIEYKVETKI